MAQREVLRKGSSDLSRRQELDGLEFFGALRMRTELMSLADLVISDNRRHRRVVGKQQGAIRLDHLQGHGQVHKQVSERRADQIARETRCAKGQRFLGWEFFRHR